MKKLLRSTAVLLLACIILPVISMTASGAGFVPRTRLPYENEDAYKYYFDGQYNIFTKFGYGIPNCTAYAYGRAYELLGEIPSLCSNGAHKWYDYNINQDKYPYGQTPKLGAIACWRSKDNSTGHVAVVEAINDKYVELSESWYGKKDFVYYKNCDKSTMAYYNTGYIFQGFIYILPDGSGSSQSYNYLIGNYTLTSNVNLRSTPDTSNSPLATIPSGSVVKVEKLNKNWGYVSYNGKTGWICLDYAERDNSNQPGLYCVAVNEDSNLLIRSQPSTSGSQLGKIPRGEHVKVDNITENWGYTVYNGVSGWICLDYAEYLAAESIFTDLQLGAWYSEAANYVYLRGIVKGVSASSFAPNDNMTRAMFVQMLANMAGVDTSKYSTDVFSDVTSDKWYAGAVAWAYKNGIVNGTGGGKFAPDSNITREQMCTMLKSFADYSGVTLAGSHTGAAGFADSKSISSWAYNGVDLAAKAGLINGKPGGIFDPQGLATRVEAAQVIMGYMKY